MAQNTRESSLVEKPLSAAGHEANRTSYFDEESITTSDAQDGVKAIEAVSMTWTRWGLIAAYLR
jgi:hypothetical protein